MQKFLFSLRRLLFKINEVVTIAVVETLFSFAILAMTGAAQVPVAPPLLNIRMIFLKFLMILEILS